MTTKKIKKIKKSKTSTANNSVVRNSRNSKIIYGTANLNAIEKYLSSQQDTFTKSMKTIANQIISNPELIRNSMLVSFAKSVNLGEASIMRFCKHLGFKGFTEFKRYFVEEFFERRDDSDTKNKIYDIDVSAQSNPADVLTKTTNLLARITLETKQNLSANSSNLSTAADKIHLAPRLYIFGTEANRHLIEEVAERFISIGVMTITATNVNDMVNKACLLTKGDVAIAVQSSGYNKEILKVVSLLQKQRVFTIGICNDPRADLSIRVDMSFTACGSYDKNLHLLQDSMYVRVSQLLIFECLIGLVTALDIQQVKEVRINSLNTIEQIVQAKSDSPTIV
ncbi:MurR/RpiR family transcriptional regulator [Psittacicella gerlachiana]|uniref:RpiR family transcriptional regulator n=1 Tax=Psittacicella gerlachiana TaxID=2028574 RepID=A0A3A1YKA0_9GAMM|nr:MurR/RpiR family transcriptional regulator [Psittacicella gerlachiana]RIY38693.1 hypothetical protein CKF59_00465 [Psittacicella gerlachiana]